ncbi:MAG: nitrous oxide reductase family maturation protein NosD [Promethearchaeota archaeon]
MEGKKILEQKKLKSTILLIFFIILVICFIRLNQDFNFIDIELERNEKVSFHTSGFWNVSYIFIDGLATGPDAHNWTWVISQDWYGGGNGSRENPFLIENITTRSISIQHSNKYFTLNNCTVFNSTDTAIYLYNVSNGKIIGNKCLFNENGIALNDCSNTTISSNEIDASNFLGLSINNSFNNTIVNNLLSKCGISISYSSTQNESNIIDNSNLINGKPFYFYVNEINLGYANFTNAGQIVLHNCNDSLISDLNLSQCSSGISLFNCHNNSIENNCFTNNSIGGIGVTLSTNIIIKNNTFTNNYIIGMIPSRGIEIASSTNNIIRNNIFHRNIIGIGIGLSTYGIESSRNQIYGNNISNGLCGILIYDGEKNNISKNFLMNNYYAIYGDCDESLFLNNSLSHNKVGIELIYSNFNNFSHNSIFNNEIGVNLISSQENRLLQNNLANNSKAGIYLERSDNNNMTENILSNNEHGIKLNGSSYNQIGYNEIYNNKVGIYLDQSYFDPYGLPIVKKCEYNQIFSNQINFNKDNGIYIREGLWNNISNNNIHYNNKNGILLEHSDLNYILENIINFNYCGINLTASDYNQVNGNSLYQNIICIYEDYNSSYNSFENNNCFEAANGQWVFFLIIGCILLVAGLVLIVFVKYPRKKAK